MLWRLELWFPQEIAANTLNATNVGSWNNILVYHGMISRQLYDCMRAKTEGIYFFFPFIDIWAHNLIAFHCEKLLQVDDPVSIYGTSGSSSGVSWHKTLDKKSKKSPAGQKWIDGFREDPIAARSGWQPHIKTLRYHDLCALEHAQRHGLLPPDTKIDREIWFKAIFDEIKAQPWSLAPWLTAEPHAPVDAELFKLVRKHFAKLAKKLPKPPEAKYEPTYPETLLRVNHLKRGYKDDVEGAMLALHDLMSDGHPVYDVEKEQKPLDSPRPAGLRERLLKSFDKAPPAAQVLLFRLLPKQPQQPAGQGENLAAARQTKIVEQLFHIRAGANAPSATHNSILIPSASSA